MQAQAGQGAVCPVRVQGRDQQIRSRQLTTWLNRRAPSVRALSLLRSEPVLTCRTAEAFMGVERFFHDFYPVPVEGVRGLLEGMGSLEVGAQPTSQTPLPCHPKPPLLRTCMLGAPREQ